MKSFFNFDELICKISHVSPQNISAGNYHSTVRTHCELVYKKNGGNSTQIFDDRTIIFKPKCVYFIPAFSENRVSVDNPGEIINIRFDLKDTDVSELFPEIIQLSEHNSIENIFEKILTVWEEQSPTFRFEAQALLMQIMTEIKNIRMKEYLSSSSYHKVLPAFGFIEENYRRSIEISELTALCGISDIYLRRLFRHFKNCTPTEYLRHIRLQKARELLLKTDRSISAVANAVGYDDPQYFSRLYSREFGEAPRNTKNKCYG